MELRIFTEPQQGATYDDLLRVALHAERLGFDAFFRSDHFLTMGGDGLPGPTDAWITLAGLARDTSTIRLGTLVSAATFRLPGPLAVVVAQVDQMSGGRVELGLGTGWFDAEHTAYGIPFPPLGERFERFEEQLTILAGLWTSQGPFSHAGKHYGWRTARRSPAPPSRRCPWSSEAAERPGRPAWRRPSQPSSTCRSRRSRRPPSSSDGYARPAR